MCLSCIMKKKKEELEPIKISVPQLPKEYSNMRLLLDQAMEWRKREELRLEKQTLSQLKEYVGNFTEEK